MVDPTHAIAGFFDLLDINGPLGITSNDDLLADPIFGIPVDGVAADGVARVVLRIKVPVAGEKYRIKIDEFTSREASGALDSLRSESVEKTAVSKSDGSFVFATYVAPNDFVRQGQAGAGDASNCMSRVNH